MIDWNKGSLIANIKGCHISIRLMHFNNRKLKSFTKYFYSIFIFITLTIISAHKLISSMITRNILLTIPDFPGGSSIFVGLLKVNFFERAVLLKG